MKKAVLYARVSSKEQEREGFSIPAQQKLLREYAITHNIKIVEEFVEAETAKTAGRRQFNNMLSYMKKHTDVRIILVEKTDRLYRNLKDYVSVDDIKDVEIHFVKEGTILSENSRSQDKFMHGIRVLMAKNYIDNLSEEIKKGLQEKAEQGYCPTKAPVGYKNKKLSTGKRIIIVDDENAKYIQQAFLLYASGNETYESVANKLAEDGFRPNGRLCKAKNIERILNNPFYIGAFKYKDKYYNSGQHEPIIEKELYFIVQKCLAGKYPTKPQKRNFAYNGLIKCANCGCQIVGEIKKGKYIYYHCTNAKKLDKSKPSIRQEKIEETFGDFIKDLYIPKEEFERLKRTVKEILEEGFEYIEVKNENIKKRIDLLNRRLSKLYDDKIDGVITEDLYLTKRNDWQNELDELLFKFEKTANSSQALFDEVYVVLELAKNLDTLYNRQTSEEKAKLMKLLTVELLFDGEKLTITPHSAFENLIKMKKRQNVESMSQQSNFIKEFINSCSDIIFIERIKLFLALKNENLLAGNM